MYNYKQQSKSQLNKTYAGNEQKGNCNDWYTWGPWSYNRDHGFWFRRRACKEDTQCKGKHFQRRRKGELQKIKEKNPLVDEDDDDELSWGPGSQKKTQCRKEKFVWKIEEKERPEDEWRPKHKKLKKFKDSCLSGVFIFCDGKPEEKTGEKLTGENLNVENIANRKPPYNGKGFSLGRVKYYNKDGTRRLKKNNKKSEKEVEKSESKKNRRRAKRSAGSSGNKDGGDNEDGEHNDEDSDDEEESESLYDGEPGHCGINMCMLCELDME